MKGNVHDFFVLVIYVCILGYVFIAMGFDPPPKKLNLQVFCTSDHIINTYLLSCKDHPVKIESCNSLKISVTWGIF